MLGVFSALDIAASGLTAQRTRMNTIASNVANVRTTRTTEGGAFRRLDPLFTTGEVKGAGAPGEGGVSRVVVERVVRDPRQGMMVHDPSHPDANSDGYVEYPNIEVVEEMVNMITASRAYEAGVSTIESVKTMARSAINIAGG